MTTRVEEEGLEARRRELEEGRRRTEDVTWSGVPFPCPCHDQPRLWIHHCALVPQLWPWTTPTSGPIADSRHGSCRDYIHAAKGFRRGHGTRSFSRCRDVDGLRLGAVASTLGRAQIHKGTGLRSGDESSRVPFHSMT